MCISILSTAHPDYPYIILSNRDEFLKRPTAEAQWWDPPNEHVLGGRDLQREERGTWLGVTRQGRIAVLTNFREEGVEVSKGKSRGGLVNSYLMTPAHSDESPEDFVDRLIRDTGIQDVGGFSLLFGQLRVGHDDMLPGLCIVSNRTSSARGLTKLATSFGETHGLSNSHYGDITWPKVVHGEKFLQEAIETNINSKDGEDNFIEALFAILSVDTLPRPKNGEDFQIFARQLRNSILVPPVGGDPIENTPGDKIASATAKSDHGQVSVGEGMYATQKQTVILVNQQGRLNFVERTLFDASGASIPLNQGERRFEFDIEGWKQQ